MTSWSGWANVSDVELPSVLRDLVGEEGLGTTANLVGNLEKLPEIFALVQDEAQYAGSAQAEFNARIETTAAKMQMVKNTFQTLATDIGGPLLVGINHVLEGAVKLVDIIENLAAGAKEVWDNISGWITAVRDALSTFESFKTSVGEILDWIIEKAEAVGKAIKDAVTFDLPNPFESDPDTPGGAARLERRRRNAAQAPGPGWRAAAAAGAPGRALGGHVRAGMAYEWQEAGRELLAPITDGRVISNAELRRLGQPSGSSSSVAIGDIHVHAAPGMDPRAIARAVREELKAAMRTRAPLHDGAVHG